MDFLGEKKITMTMMIGKKSASDTKPTNHLYPDTHFHREQIGDETTTAP